MSTHNRNRKRVLAGSLFFACLLLTPAAWAQCGSTAINNTNYTTSTRTINHITTANVTQEASTFLVELKARMQGGAYLSDQTYNVAFADPAVQAAVTQAKSLLTSAGAVSFTGPTQLSNTPVHQQRHEHRSERYRNQCLGRHEQLHRAPDHHDRRQPEPVFYLARGPGRYRHGDHFDVYITQTVTTTNTTLTSQVYELDGVPARIPPATPAPPSLLLALTGIAASGLYALRRRRRRGASTPTA